MSKSSGANLTFAFDLTEPPNGECQIQSSTGNLIIASGPSILAFADERRMNGMRMLELDYWDLSL